MRGSYAIGLVHGVGGSGGIGLLLLAAIPDDGTGLLALGLFALFTALSMRLASTLFGRALAGQRVRSRLRVTPAMAPATSPSAPGMRSAPWASSPTSSDTHCQTV